MRIDKIPKSGYILFTFFTLACTPLLHAEMNRITEDDLHHAHIAWKYFEKNYLKFNGMVDASKGFHSTTMWDLASYLAALDCAYRLKIIDEDSFNQRCRLLLSTLEHLPLFEGKL